VNWLLLNLGEFYHCNKGHPYPNPTNIPRQNKAAQQTSCVALSPDYHTSVSSQTTPSIAVGNMAPKVAQANSRVLGPLTRIVPAVPLVYLQKRKQAITPCENETVEIKDQAVEATISTLSPRLTPTPLPVEALLFDATPIIVNGSASEHTLENPQKFVERPNSVTSSIAPETEEEVLSTANTVSGASTHETTGKQTHALNSKARLTNFVDLSAEEKNQREASEGSELPSLASRSTFQMPPPFIPASQSQSNSTNQAHIFVPQHPRRQSQVQHAHPGAGTQVFSAYPESSNNSSPVPPASAGNAPPYPYQQQQQPYIGHNGPHTSNGSYTQYMSNGHPTRGPPPPPGFFPRPDNYLGQGPEGYVLRPLPPGFTGGYSPSLTPPSFDNHRPAVYDPSTPQSFQGSQASVTNEQDPACSSQYHAAVPNGTNGFVDESRQYPRPPRPHPTTGSHMQQPPNYMSYPVLPNPEHDSYDGLVYYLRNHFANPEFADWQIELRYTDDRAQPVRIPGHSLIFARSPKLKSLMEVQSQAKNGKTLLIESSDRYLRSDGFNMAIERLYGGRLMSARDDYEPTTGQSYFATNELSTQRFETALGYAVAGCILDLHIVTSRGLQVASEFISWQTIEKAFDFAIDGGLLPHWVEHGEVTNTPTYGTPVGRLLSVALDFVSQNFPVNFHLDCSATEPIHNRRLPAITQDRAATQSKRLSSLKFGDHPGDHSVKYQNDDPISASLSRILLNLPFPLLKYALESDLLGANEGWAGRNHTIRDNAMRDLVKEREARRLKALSSISSTTELSSSFYEALHMCERAVLHDGVLQLDRKLEVS